MLGRIGVWVAPIVAYFYLLNFPLNHDVAWLLEATQRWVAGAELYRDIIEINPPLIFVENILLSGGLLTKHAFLAGVCLSILLSSLWVQRWGGPALVVALALTLPATLGFGQRDHLALIFLTPYVLAPSELSRKERIALGLWAFLGVGLKPHFLLIPGAFTAAQCIRERSFKSAFVLQNWTIGVLCVAWLGAAVLIWPRYFTEIIPLGREVYSSFGVSITAMSVFLVILSVALSIFVAIRHKALIPLAGAILGAVAVLLLQGRFWNYHFIPVFGLAVIASMAAADREAGLWRMALGFAGLVLLAVNPLKGPRRYVSVIPSGVKSVLFLSDRVPAAYPSTFECGARNASRYPTFWTLPEAWNRSLADLFRREVANMNEDIRRERPEIIYEDSRLPKFKRPFSFTDWADLSNYRYMGRSNRYHVWLRRDLAPNVLTRIRCGNG